MRFFDQVKLKIFLKLHTYLYKRINSLSKNLNNNIHPKHRIMNYHQFFIDNIQKDSKVLDIGCGSGSLTHDIAKKAQKVLAIDINKKSIDIAKIKFHKKNIKYIVGDVTKYEFNESFDYIILSNVLEHIKDRYDFLNKIKLLTKYILIRVPMINRSWLPLYKKELGLEFRLDPTHYIEYTYELFKKEIESVRLKILSYNIQFGEIWAKIGFIN